MKNFNYSLTFIAILTLLFTSCSKEETDVSGLDNQDTFQMQFDVNLNDFNKQLNKDHLSDDPVECSEADPAYVLVALTDSNGDWVAGKNPEANGAGVDDFIKVNLKDNNGSWETVYSAELGMPAGTYQLQYFIVYSADDMVLWVAPREGGAYAGSVDDPLPQEIVLGAGTKPYVEVDVLCFVPRVEEAFGYIFFDINAIAIENNYCIFVNFCDDETGREYPALFEVDVWLTSTPGTLIVDGEMNSVSGSGNSFAATVLCLPLPPLTGGATYTVRVTVLDAGAYDADASDFFEFTISQADINAQILEVPAYEHIRINCGDDNGNGECDPNDDQADCDNDTIPNGQDECPGEDDRLDLDSDGIPDACDEDRDGDGILNGPDLCADDLPGEGYIDEDRDGCNDGTSGCVNDEICDIDDVEFPCITTYLGGLDDTFLESTGIIDAELLGVDDVLLGLVNATFVEGELVVTINPSETFALSGYVIEVRPLDSNTGEMSMICKEYRCEASAGENASETSFENIGNGDTFFIRVKAIICPPVLP